MIRVDHAHLSIAALSHPGMTGKNNEDRYAVSAYQVSETDPTPAVFAVLSDGIGGHQAGEVAAELAVEALSQYVAESDAQHPVQILEAAVIEASQQIYQYAQRDGHLEGMGATCACVWVIGDRLYCAAIGDSRIYLLRGETIRQISTDHTWIQEALDQGLLKPEEKRGHPNAHVIRRFLGSSTPPQVDVRLRLEADEDDPHAQANQGMPLQPGDKLLLCSDGLTDLVRDAEILGATANRTLEAGVQSLVELANARGGHDNITVVLLEYPPVQTAVGMAAHQSKAFSWWKIGCGGALLLALAWVLWFYAMGFSGGVGGGKLLATSSPTVAPLLFPPDKATEFPTAVPSMPVPSATNAPERPVATYTPWPTNAPISLSSSALP